MSKQPDDASSDLLIREVDEELRQEQMNKLWKKYGKVAIGAAVVVVLAVAGGQAWTVYQKNTQETASMHFGNAVQMADQGRLDDALLALSKLSQDTSSKGYALLADMRRASLLQEKGDVAGAAAAYEAVANANYNPVYADLARLRAAYLLVDGENSAKAVQLVQPLDNDKSPWRSSAREVQALVALKGGDQAKAIEFYNKIVQDIGAPQNLRTRATEMVAVLSK